MKEENIDKDIDKILGDQKPPDNYLALAIISTIVCFAPIGVFSLFYSLRVNQYWEEKKYAKSRRASILTRVICVWTIVAGIIFWVGILFGAIYNIFGNRYLVF
ncbi:CD225/dispanin family protein [Apibacter muscae]|uniref:CD225/dispanin family protein n=1 Tax=Apibacter muscae TaxID=2509004 RepID=UPI0016290B6B|nr:CD225/dispanin family protein [Apibacter muscae]